MPSKHVTRGAGDAVGAGSSTLGALIEGTRPRQICQGRKGGEERCEYERAEDETGSVVDSNGLERQLANPAPVEQVLDDRQACDRDVSSGASAKPAIKALASGS